MKKTVLILMSVLLSIGMFSACSSDDDVVTPEVPETTSHSTRQLPKQADFIKTMTDIGYLKRRDLPRLRLGWLEDGTRLDRSSGIFKRRDVLE